MNRLLIVRTSAIGDVVFASPFAAAVKRSWPQAHLAFMRNSKNISFKESADHIKQVGASSFIISTDLGQTANPLPPDGLAWLIAGLMSQGITKEQVQTMGRENPGKLLMG